MSTVDRKNLLDYLPPEQKQKILTLVQRLKEETEAKQKYAGLYSSSQKALGELTEKFNKLKDENSYLKQQIHNSFSMVSQVRATFKANNQKLSTQNQTSHPEQDWQDESDEEEENKQQNSQTVQSSHPPRPHNKSPLDKYRPQLTSSKKNNNILNISTIDHEHSTTNLSASKSKELEELRKEVRALQDSKKKTAQATKEYEEKRKLVDQIKNRYKSTDSSKQIHPKNHPQQSHIEKIDISDTFENKAEPIVTQHRPQASKKYQKQQPKQQPKQQAKQRPKQQARQQGKQWVTVGKPQISSLQSKQAKSKMLTNQDYGDVLQMINSYNL